MKLLNKYTSTRDKLVAYVSSPDGEVPLTAKEQIQMERINMADNLMNRDFTDREIVYAMKKRYPALSDRTFYNDINDAKYVFGSCAIFNKKYDRKWLMELHKRHLKLIIEAEDWASVVRMHKQMYLTAGLHNTDDEALDPKQYGNHNYYLIMKGDVNQNTQINLKDAEKIPDAELDVIIEKVNSHFDDQQSQQLLGFLKNKPKADE